MMAEQRHGPGTVESLHLDPQVGRDRHSEWLESLEISKLTPSDTPPSTRTYH